MAKADLTAQRLRELLDYDPETGCFTWRVDRHCGRGRVVLKAGDAAGRVRPNGYIEISINRCRIQAHRAAWIMTFGVVPIEIDHINGIRTDNRLCNLRNATRAMNAQNMRAANASNKSSGLLGSHWCKSNKAWQAKIKLGGKTIHIGFYANKEDAHEAYKAKKRLIHAGCTI